MHGHGSWNILNLKTLAENDVPCIAFEYFKSKDLIDVLIEKG